MTGALVVLINAIYSSIHSTSIYYVSGFVLDTKGIMMTQTRKRACNLVGLTDSNHEVCYKYYGRNVKECITRGLPPLSGSEEEVSLRR